MMPNAKAIFLDHKVFNLPVATTNGKVEILNWHVYPKHQP